MPASHDDLLRAALTSAEPLGPVAHERLDFIVHKDPAVLSDIVYDRIAYFRDVVTKPHMLYLGRKGAGKSALLSQIRLGAHKRGRLGRVYSNDPIPNRDYVIDVASWEHFNQIVQNVGQRFKEETVLNDLIPPEYYA